MIRYVFRHWYFCLNLRCNFITVQLCRKRYEKQYDSIVIFVTTFSPCISGLSRLCLQNEALDSVPPHLGDEYGGSQASSPSNFLIQDVLRAI